MTMIAESVSNSQVESRRLNHGPLRCLVVIEIIMTIFAISVYYLQDPFLPETLQEYERGRGGFDSIMDHVLFQGFLVQTILLIVSWVGLLRGWLCGRKLYTLTWIVAAVLAPFSGPTVDIALGSMVGSAGILISGMIFGILYFSEARHFYDGEKRDASGT
jgi:hypothetical protein